jgi:YD repeat-containing protein
VGCGNGPQEITKYDGLERVREAKTGDGSTTRMVYAGNRTTVTDAAGVGRKLEHDGAGRLTAVTENPAGTGADRIANYSYNALDRLVSVTQTGSAARTFGYDTLGRLTSATQPEWDGSATYVYDDSGNLVTKTDPRGMATTMTYDGAGRLTGKSYTEVNTPAVTYCYDGKVSEGTGCGLASPVIANGVGRLTEVRTARTDGTGVTRRRYTGLDAVGRVVKSEQSYLEAPQRDYGFEYTWDAGGWLSMVKYPSGRVVNYTADAGGRVNRVANAAGTAWATVNEFAAHGAAAKTTLGNNVVERWTWSPGRLQARRLQVGTETAAEQVGKLEWSYCVGGGADTECASNNGNVMAQWVQPVNEAQTYGYDSRNRLTSAEGKEGAAVKWRETASYDGRGFQRAFRTDPR